MSNPRSSCPRSRPAWRLAAHVPASAAQRNPPNAEYHYRAYHQPTPYPFADFRSCHFPAGTLTALESQPRVSFHSCLEGPVRLIAATGSYDLDAGAFLLFAPGLLYQWRNDGSG